MKLAFKKRETGTRKSQNIRKEGGIPVVCYGHSKKTEHFSIQKKAFKTILDSEVPVIDSDGDLKNKKLLIQQIDRNPVNDSVLHVDFLFVDEQHRVEHEVPLIFIGEAPATKTGGFVEHAKNSVVVSALPSEIPSKLEVSLESLTEIGSHLKVSQITLPKNVEMITPKEDVVLSITQQKEEEVEEQETEDIDFENIEVQKKGKEEVDSEGETAKE